MKACNLLLACVILAEALTFAVRLALRPSNKPPDVVSHVLRPPMARDLARRLQSLDPQSVADWHRAGKMLRAVGSYPEAEYCFRQLNAMLPGNPQYLRDWASVLARQGRTAESSEIFRRAVNAGDPAPEDCWLGIGQNCLREEDVTGAIEAFHRAPSKPRAQYLLCRVLYRSGRAAEARQRLEQVLAAGPRGLEFCKLMSWTLVELNELQEAERYRQLSMRSPTVLLPDVFQREDMRLRERMGEGAVIQEALGLPAGQDTQSFDKISALLNEAWTTRAADTAAQLAGRLNKFDEAKRLLEVSLLRSSDTIETLQALGEAHAASGDEAEARRVWLRAAEILGSAELHTLLALSYKRTGDTAQYFRHQALAQFEQGKLLWERNALEHAKRELAAAADALADHAHAWFYLADTLRELGEQEQARIAYEKCLKINPEHGRAHQGLMLLDHEIRRAGS